MTVTLTVTHTRKYRVYSFVCVGDVYHLDLSDTWDDDDDYKAI